MRLYGKRSTEEKITNEIVRLLLGKEEILTVHDVAKRLGFSRDTVYTYIQNAVRAGLISYKPSGMLAISANLGTELGFRRFSKLHPITTDPLVAEWKQDLLTRKQGESLVSWKNRIRAIESVCNTCMIDPRDLIISQRHTEKILKIYAEMYREGKAVRRPAGVKKIPIDIRKLFIKRSRHFTICFGIVCFNPCFDGLVFQTLYKTSIYHE